jgi:hypothetical protein
MLPPMSRLPTNRPQRGVPGDPALEIATSMGSMPGTTICGLADGNNWAIRTILNKFPDEFKARVKPTFVPVKISVGAMAKS